MSWMDNAERLTSGQVWLNAATLVFTVWLALLFLDASVLPGIRSDVVEMGLPASIGLFGVGFGLFAWRQNRL